LIKELIDFMIANTIEMNEFKKYESFFDYWHYSDVDALKPAVPKKVAEEIAEKIKLKKIYEEFPEHCSQLLFLS
jgi:hypothetical protein